MVFEVVGSQLAAVCSSRGVKRLFVAIELEVWKLSLEANVFVCRGWWRAVD